MTLTLVHKHANSKHAIETLKGECIDVFNLAPDDLSIEIIAHGLATNTRWGGFYDLDITGDMIYVVAQHAVYVSEAVEEEHPEAYLAQLIALHHDDSEGLIKDFPTPIKRGLPWYEALEGTVQGVCYERFCGVTVFNLHEHEARFEAMHKADARLLDLEGRWMEKTYLGEGGPKLFTDWKAGDHVWTPKEAKANFIARHNYLVEKLAGL